MKNLKTCNYEYTTIETFGTKMTNTCSEPAIKNGRCKEHQQEKIDKKLLNLFESIENFTIKKRPSREEAFEILKDFLHQNMITYDDCLDKLGF